MFCPSCGQDNVAEARFCASCGSMLEEVSSVATPHPVAPLYAAVEYAGFRRRFAAWAIDSVIVLFGFVLFVAAGVSDTLYHFPFFRFFFLSELSAIVLGWLYFVLLTGLRGQTVGKMVLGIKVVRADGRVPGLGYAALQEIVGKIVSTIALFLGFLWIAWDARKRGWQDYIAGTQVIRTRG